MLIFFICCVSLQCTFFFFDWLVHGHKSVSMKEGLTFRHFAVVLRTEHEGTGGVQAGAHDPVRAPGALLGNWIFSQHSIGLSGE